MLRKFQAYWVEEDGPDKFKSSLVERSDADLPPGEVLIRVRYSSLNYKDALSAAGNRGVTRNYPHTPGIDAAGEVLASESSKFSVGEEVIVIGYDLGMNTPGGFGQMIRVPAAWVLSRPAGLSLKDSMVLGTAGLTAAVCVEKLLTNGLADIDGEILVTGASGGVGAIAVALLSKLGFQVAASTGKTAQHDWLRKLGAAAIVNRDELAEPSSKPLLKERWGGAVDVVGGQTLVNILKSLRYGASASCCGLVSSPKLEASVFPFILRGVNLLGVDSVQLPLSKKQQVFERFGGEWKLDELEMISKEISMSQLDEKLASLLQGQTVGRVVLNLDL